MITLHHDNVQVTIFVMCLNFAGTGSQILLHSLSLCRRVIPSRKFTLNLNGEVNYRALARRSWYNYYARYQLIFAFILSHLKLIRILMSRTKKKKKKKEREKKVHFSRKQAKCHLFRCSTPTPPPCLTSSCPTC